MCRRTRREDAVKTVNALTIRNQLGAVLDALDRDGEPILVSRGHRVRAVLVTPEDFARRFVDKQADDARRALLERVDAQQASRTGERDSLAVLRELRGYPP